MSRRRVRPDELELWHQVARGAKPLERRGKTPAPAPPAKPERRAEPRPEPAAPLTPFTIGAAARNGPSGQSLPQSTRDRIAGDPVRMDQKSFARLKRGKLKPEARLDLHGMTLDQAHPRLTGFILRAHGQGLRLVLVITGKGSGDDPYDSAPRTRGVLRRQVPLWLRQGVLTSAVLQIAPAHIRHGGDGAYYVYLRRPR